MVFHAPRVIHSTVVKPKEETGNPAVSKLLELPWARRAFH